MTSLYNWTRARADVSRGRSQINRVFRLLWRKFMQLCAWGARYRCLLFGLLLSQYTVEIRIIALLKIF